MVAAGGFVGEPPPPFVVEIQVVPQRVRRVAGVEGAEAPVTVVPPAISGGRARMMAGGHQSPGTFAEKHRIARAVGDRRELGA